MICYHHPTSTSPPDHLIGGKSLVRRTDKDGFLYGMGQACFLGNKNNVVQLSDGWTAWINGGVEPLNLVRDNTWLRKTMVRDLNGDLWFTSVVLNTEGKRDFKVKYGADFKPSLTVEQSSLLNRANTVREMFSAAMSSESEPDEDERAAFAFHAAHFIAAANHITVEVISKLGLSDEDMVLQTIVAALSHGQSSE